MSKRAKSIMLTCEERSTLNTWARGRSLPLPALHTPPSNATHWSTRTMAQAQGLSEATVRRIWKRHNLKPHLIKTFKLSRDRRFVEKLTDIVGLYVNPPDKALV